MVKSMTPKNQVTLSLRKAACQRLEMERQTEAFFATEAERPVREKAAYQRASVRVLCREETQAR